MKESLREVVALRRFCREHHCSDGNLLPVFPIFSDQVLNQIDIFKHLFLHLKYHMFIIKAHIVLKLPMIF